MSHVITIGHVVRYTQDTQCAEWCSCDWIWMKSTHAHAHSHTHTNTITCFQPSVPAVVLLVLMHGYTLCYCGQHHPGTNMVWLQQYLCETCAELPTGCTDTNQGRCHNCSCGMSGVEKLVCYMRIGTFQSRVLGVLCDYHWNPYHHSWNAHEFPDKHTLHLLYI